MSVCNLNSPSDTVYTQALKKGVRGTQGIEIGKDNEDESVDSEYDLNSSDETVGNFD